MEQYAAVEELKGYLRRMPQHPGIIKALEYLKDPDNGTALAAKVGAFLDNAYPVSPEEFHDAFTHKCGPFYDAPTMYAYLAKYCGERRDDSPRWAALEKELRKKLHRFLM